MAKKESSRSGVDFFSLSALTNDATVYLRASAFFISYTVLLEGGKDVD